MVSVSAPVIAAGVGAAGSLASGVIGAGAASDAADQQAQAAQEAAANQMAMFNKEQENLKPFMQFGQAGQSALGSLLGLNKGENPLSSLLLKPFNPTMQDLESTPGYQFTLDQGLKGTQNSYAAQGLARSGAAMKGAAQYSEGLAESTYQQQFSNYLSQNQQIYNMLGGVVQTGLGAATNTANMGMQAASQASNYLTSGAAASAAGTIGSANALSAGIGGIGSAVQNYAMMSMLPNMFGTGSQHA